MKSIKTENQYAKANYYHSDGTGRDTYIGFDNGGLTLHNRNAIQPPVGAFRPKRQPQIFRPQSSHKTLHYVSDGSGRDNYVLDNHGGLLNTQPDAFWMHNFKRSLRTPDRPRPKSGMRTPTIAYQQKVIRRLSIPKNQRVPFHKQVEKYEIQGWINDL